MNTIKQLFASHAGQQVLRFVRLFAVAVGASAVVPSLVSGTVNRTALVAAVVGAVEVAVRQMFPTLPASFTDPKTVGPLYEHAAVLLRDEVGQLLNGHLASVLAAVQSPSVVTAAPVVVEAGTGVPAAGATVDVTAATEVAPAVAPPAEVPPMVDPGLLPPTA